MTEKQFKTSVQAPVTPVYNWHRSPAALIRSAHPKQELYKVSMSANEVTFSLKEGLKRFYMKLRIDAMETDTSIKMTMTRGPFKTWVHTKTFEVLEKDRTAVADTIEYNLPFGVAGVMINDWEVRRDLERNFHYYHQRLKEDMKRLMKFDKKRGKRILITGSHGFLGKQLAAFLEAGGYDVFHLVRHKNQVDNRHILWNPDAEEIDAEALARANPEIVIHLAGSSISKRWTKKYKQYMLSNRSKSARTLSNALAAMKKKPESLIVASAIGFYGDRGDKVVTEASRAGNGFPAELCKKLEKETQPAEQAGIRTCHARFGVILGFGGAIKQMLPAFKLGLGGPLGNGKQFMSWIALDDAVYALHHLMHTAELSGPVNVTAPVASSNKAFSRALGKALHRPALLPMPRFIVRLLFGQMGQELLLEGARLQPKKLEETGFVHSYPDLTEAIKWGLGR